MALNLYDTKTMLKLQEVVKPKSTFLRDRFFPTAPEDIFTTEEVLVDFKDEQGSNLAPVVIPDKGGIPMNRGGYQTHIFTPPLVAPERSLTANQLMKRAAGEAVFSGIPAAQRAAKYLTDDIADLNMSIDLREEYMAAQTLLNNAYTLTAYADRFGVKGISQEFKFYTEGSNPATYTINNSWDGASADIIGDLAAMADLLTSRGLGASDVVVAGNVADVMLNNATVLKLLDNRRFILAQEVNPTATDDGAVLLAVLNVKGHIMNIFAYTREYVGDDGNTAKFIPDNKVVVTAAGMGRTAYGAITQIEEDTQDFATYAASRVPHVVTNAHDNTRTLIQQSRPIVLPKVRNAAISATAIFA